MAARTHSPYNPNDDSLELDYVIVERALLLSPWKDPRFFVPQENGFYDQIGQEFYFEDQNEWVPLAKLQKYRNTYESITKFDGTNPSEGTELSLNTVPNSLVREQADQSFLLHDFESSIDMETVITPSSLTVVPGNQNRNIIDELLDEFAPMASGVVALGSPSATATGPSPYSADTQPVESTLRVALRAQRPVERQLGGVKPPSESDLEDTAESDLELNENI